MKYILDSSAWLEFFAGGEIADQILPILEDMSQVYVPSFVLAEVFRSLLPQTSVNLALRAIAHMQLGNILDLDLESSMAAARIGANSEYHLLECYLLAFAKTLHAELWTTQEHLAKAPNVQLLGKKSDMRSFRFYR